MEVPCIDLRVTFRRNIILAFSGFFRFDVIIEHKTDFPSNFILCDKNVIGNSCFIVNMIECEVS